MQLDDKPAFAATLAGVAAVKRVQLTPEAYDLWWLSMQHWPLPEFRSAAVHLLRTREFMPSPKDFEDLRKAGRPTCGEAWQRAVAAAGSCYRAGHFGPGGTSADPLIDRVVAALGGYAVIAACDVDKLHFLERRFAEHYETIQDAEDVRQTLPQIAGPSQLPQVTATAKRLTVAR